MRCSNFPGRLPSPPQARHIRHGRNKKRTKKIRASKPYRPIATEELRILGYTDPGTPVVYTTDKTNRTSKKFSGRETEKLHAMNSLPEGGRAGGRRGRGLDRDHPARSILWRKCHGVRMATSSLISTDLIQSLTIQGIPIRDFLKMCDIGSWGHCDIALISGPMCNPTTRH